MLPCRPFLSSSHRTTPQVLNFFSRLEEQHRYMSALHCQIKKKALVFFYHKRLSLLSFFASFATHSEITLEQDKKKKDNVFSQSCTEFIAAEGNCKKWEMRFANEEARTGRALLHVLCLHRLTCRTHASIVVDTSRDRQHRPSATCSIARNTTKTKYVRKKRKKERSETKNGTPRSWNQTHPNYRREESRYAAQKQATRKNAADWEKGCEPHTKTMTVCTRKRRSFSLPALLRSVVLLLRRVGNRLKARRWVLRAARVKHLEAVARQLAVVALGFVDVLVHAVHGWQRCAVHRRVVEQLAVHRVVLVRDVTACKQLVVRVVRQSLLHQELWQVLAVAGTHVTHRVASEGVELWRHVSLVLQLPRPGCLLLNVLLEDACAGQAKVPALRTRHGELVRMCITNPVNAASQRATEHFVALVVCCCTNAVCRCVELSAGLTPRFLNDAESEEEKKNEMHQ